MVRSIVWWSFTKFVQTKVSGSRMTLIRCVCVWGGLTSEPQKFIQKSSEPLGPDVCNFVCSIALCFFFTDFAQMNVPGLKLVPGQVS